MWTSLEYEAMCHMTVQNECSLMYSYFLPHHEVNNENSSTTWLRVAINDSSPSHNEMSLKDIQYVGPNIQDDIWSILLKSRWNNIVVWYGVQMVHLQRVTYCFFRNSLP